MPELVKATVASTKRAAGHEVVVVTENNVGDYIDIPDFIYDRVKTGQMLFAHLSDYIRVNLLYRYGGLWIDSTILCTGKLPEGIFDMRFFTVRSVANGNRYVAKGRWNVQVLGSDEKYNRVFFFLKSLFEEYLRKYSKMIDYLLLDYCFQFIYDHDEKSRVMFDAVPFSNPSMHLLRGILNDVYDGKALERLTSDGTYLFKLSYKMNLLKQKDGKETYYGHLIAPNP